MSRHSLASRFVAAALVLSPVVVLAADKGPHAAVADRSQRATCHCSHDSARSSGTSAQATAPETKYQGATKEELERIWASP